MGFLSNLFGGSSSQERKLEDYYVQMIQTVSGMTRAETLKVVRELMRKAKEEGQREGTAAWPEDLGDKLLATENSDEKTRATLAFRRQEGVRDEDIRWWWNMPDLERRMLAKADDLARFASFTDSLQKGLTPDQATTKIRKCFVMYGDPRDTSNTSGDDRLLPDELRDRVNSYIQKRIEQNPALYRSEIENSSSYNATVRNAIRGGHL